MAATGPRRIKLKMLRDARYRAKRDDIPFNLTEDDIDVPTLCPVLGIPLKPGQGRPSDTSPTLDRVVPGLGYVPGNVVVVSYRANRFKSDATLDELESLARFYRHFLKTQFFQQTRKRD